MRIGEVIYLDHQATTPVDEHVFAKMIPFFTKSFGNPHSSDHVLGWYSAQAVEEAAAQLGRFIGADADEITFTSGATESNNLALLGLARRVRRHKRRRILLSTIEHKCVLAAGAVIEEQHGLTVEKIPVNHEGFIKYSALEEAMDDDVLAVSVMAVNNEVGTIQDIAKISELVRKYGAVFHCDGSQAPLAVSMESFAEQVDILSLSSHKMYGPKGVGIIYISRELQKDVEPLIYGGGQQNGLRSGTVPVPLCVGMGAAAELLNDTFIDERREKLRHCRDMFIDRIEHLSWPTVINGPAEHRRHPGNASIQFIGFSAHEIIGALQPRVAASTGSACTSGIPTPSHVLKAIGLTGDEADSSIRFSLGFGTTDMDVKDAVELIGEALNRLSSSNLMCFS